MSEKISNIILQIESKFNSIKSELTHEKNKNNELNVDIEKMKEVNKLLTSQIEVLNEELTQLKQEIEILNQKSTEIDHSKNQEKDLQIDFLVREIDQCISQIKNNL